MLEEHSECISLDVDARINLRALAECCGMTTAELDELVAYNALSPLEGTSADRVFSARWVAPLRHVAKLRMDFDLDLFTVAMVLGNLDRIAQLEQQVQALQALVPSHLQATCHE